MDRKGYWKREHKRNISECQNDNKWEWYFKIDWVKEMGSG
jgi:hypothetical protein